MNIQEHTTPEKLERYAFLWSLARLVIAAFSLFFGAMPIAYKIIGGYAAVSLMPLFWLISGVASLYLLYLWNTTGRAVFGKKDQKHEILFFIMIVTGINLGLAPLSGNLGMGLIWGMPIDGLIFKATAIVYLVVAYLLWKGWKENGEHLFGGQLAKPVESASAPAETQATETH